MSAATVSKPVSVKGLDNDEKSRDLKKDSKLEAKTAAPVESKTVDSLDELSEEELNRPINIVLVNRRIDPDAKHDASENVPLMTFPLTVRDIQQSKVFKAALEEAPTDDTIPVTIEAITPFALAKAIEWLKHHQNVPVKFPTHPLAAWELTKVGYSEWDRNFFNSIKLIGLADLATSGDNNLVESISDLPLTATTDVVPIAAPFTVPASEKKDLASSSALEPASGSNIYEPSSTKFVATSAASKLTTKIRLTGSITDVANGANWMGCEPLTHLMMDGMGCDIKHLTKAKTETYAQIIERRTKPAMQGILSAQ